MPRPTPTALPAAAVALALCGQAFAHVDDPKAKNIQPPYMGPGWRAAQGGIAGLDFPAQGVDLLSWVTLGEFASFSGQPQASANDCWGYVSPSGREYAIIGIQRGTGFVEITNPQNAVIIDVEPGPESTWRDIQIFHHYAYAVSEAGTGIQVFDLSQIDAGIVTHLTDIMTGGTQATHTVIINEESGYLYRCGGNGNGLRIYNLNINPAQPTYVTAWSDKYVHEAHAVTYTQGPYAGKEIVFCCGGLNGGWQDTGLDILDVTDKQNIEVLGHCSWPQAGYSHQGWLSDDRQYLFLDDELDESNYGLPSSRMHIINVSDLSSPFQATTFTNNVQSVDHNLYVRDGLVFASNYSSGLRVFDVANPLAPAEIAYFDTAPQDGGTNYNNLWGNYPFFPSRTVIGSDRWNGLFVWHVEALDEPIPDGDVNNDGVVNVADLVEVITNWGSCQPDCPADLNGDGEIDVLDLVIVITNWT